MAEVLVLLQNYEPHVRGVSAELLTLAGQLGDPVAVWVGESAPSAQLQTEVGNFGVRRIDWVRGPQGEDLTGGVARPVARALAHLVQENSPRAVLAASSFENKEIAAHLGHLIGAGVLTDLSAVSAGAANAAEGGAGEGSDLIGDAVIFAGTWNARSRVRTGTPILLVKPGGLEPQPVAREAAEVREVLVADAFAGRFARVVERTAQPQAEGPDLPSATTVVVGGRGTEGDFGAVEELAAELGGAVGATRVATDEGWIDHSKQVGQTGVTITPRLYIGAGVSGAVHHLSGMQAAEVIVVINSDSDAPLLEMADFGVVGDLHEILPQATAELRRLRGQ